MNRPVSNLLIHGFRISLRNWPFVLWAYAINLGFGLLAGIPFSTGLAPYLDHSLAAQRIAGTIDLSYLGELVMHLRDGSFFPMAIRTAGFLNVLQLVALFVLFAGTVFVYVSAEPARLSVLLRGGVAYCWRFVRAALMAGCIALAILGALLAIRAFALDRLGEDHVDRQLFVYASVSGAVVLLAALLLRLWWDLVEIYIVRNAMAGEPQVRRALLPAFRLLLRYFSRVVGCFLLVGIAGAGALALCLYLWKELVPAHQVWLAVLLAQLGLFLLLASRFWQRGVETALVLAADPPRVAQEEMAAVVEEEPAVAAAGVMVGTAEPTLRDLVLKLRTQPLANPELALPPPPPQELPQGNEPQVSLLEMHETKLPLGGTVPDEKPASPPALSSPSTPLPTPPPAPADKPKVLEDPKKPALPEKKP